jgi:hypothetical protein
LFLTKKYSTKKEKTLSEKKSSKSTFWLGSRFLEGLKRPPPEHKDLVPVDSQVVDGRNSLNLLVMLLLVWRKKIQNRAKLTNAFAIPDSLFNLSHFREKATVAINFVKKATSCQLFFVLGIWTMNDNKENLFLLCFCEIFCFHILN